MTGELRSEVGGFDLQPLFLQSQFDGFQALVPGPQRGLVMTQFGETGREQLRALSNQPSRRYGRDRGTGKEQGCKDAQSQHAMGFPEEHRDEDGEEGDAYYAE